MSTEPDATPVHRGYRLPDMIRRTGLKKSALYKAIKRGDLPAPKKIGRASIWPGEVIDRIMLGQPEPQATPTTAPSA